MLIPLRHVGKKREGRQSGPFKDVTTSSSFCVWKILNLWAPEELFAVRLTKDAKDGDSLNKYNIAN